MLIKNTITKKSLEKIINDTFYTFGDISSSSLLDSLKLLGFYYATNAGISINIEDLKTPKIKTKIIKEANDYTEKISENWREGLLSDTERFQSIIDNWNFVTETLKNRIIEYYQDFDPLNNLYIMAFSGARGNMSQVRQLIGMRGLMSDQEGNIIDLPIQTNFREGLTSIDYIISSYGARKGIVDTALKTADSGYLTRRLIYTAQDLIIREKDCRTNQGLILFLNKNKLSKNLLGRSILSYKTSLLDQTINIDKVIDRFFLEELKIKKIPLVKIRSSLTCKSLESICQKCYGWDLSKTKLISLGEAVGITAAQSIGEPGTQLTMRTFHTGGVFTGELLNQIVSPFSGKIIIPRNIKKVFLRTNHGQNVYKVQEETVLSIIKWNGKKETVTLPIGAFLYISTSAFIKKGQLVGEASSKSFLPATKKLKPIYSYFEGEIKFEQFIVRNIVKENKKLIKVNEEDGILWLTSGKIFPIPKESKILNTNNFILDKAFAKLKLVTPYNCRVENKIDNFLLLYDNKKIQINYAKLLNFSKNIKIKILPIVKNFQYLDNFTILAYIYFYPNCTEKIYYIRKKESNFIKTFFYITESDIWKLNSDEINQFNLSIDSNMTIKMGKTLNSKLKILNSGFLLKHDGFRMIFQKALPIFLNKGTILNYKKGDFVYKNELLATLLNYTQQNEDIVQGLPKIEDLIEARIPSKKSHLAIKPGYIVNYLSRYISKKEIKEKGYYNLPINSDNNLIKFLENDQSFIIPNSIKKFIINYKDLLIKKNIKKLKTSTFEKKELRRELRICHSLLYKENCIYKKNKYLWFVTEVPSYFTLLPSNQKNSLFWFINDETDQKFISSRGIKRWVPYKQDNDLNFLTLSDYHKYSKNYGFQALEKVNNKDSLIGVYVDRYSSDTIFEIKPNKYLLLETILPIKTYVVSSTAKILVNEGEFIDLAQPLTEGIIDPHELLSILFNYHLSFDSFSLACLRSVQKFQLILINSIQAIYQSQGVNIDCKHIEIIVRQMTSKVIIKSSGYTPFLSGELVRLSFMLELFKSFKNIKNYKIPKCEPILLSATNISLAKDGFLSSACFQETKRILAKAAIEGNKDWLRGLKESIIVGKLIPAGSSFLTYKNNLDNIFYYRKKTLNKK